MERRNQFPFAARIAFGKSARIKKSVRHVAAPTAGDADLGEELRCALEQGNITLRIRPRTRDRGEESRRATARDHDLFTSHGGLYRITLVCSHGAATERGQKNSNPYGSGRIALTR